MNPPSTLPLILITTPWRSSGGGGGGGGGTARTVTPLAAVELAPFESVTRSLTVWEPGVAKVAKATAPAVSSNCPSLSRSHCWLASGPSGSWEVDESVTGTPVKGFGSETAKFAVGGALTTIVRVTIRKPPPTSEIFRATVRGPAVAKLQVTDAPVACVGN